jgi:hypothetical protein
MRPRRRIGQVQCFVQVIHGYLTLERSRRNKSSVYAQPLHNHATGGIWRYTNAGVSWVHGNH